MITQLDIFQKDPLKIPNSVSTPNGANAVADVQNFVDLYEKEILIDGLGIELYDLLVTEYADLDNASQPIKDLVNGKEYTANSLTVKWEGLKNYSFLPYYIYWKYIQEKQDVFTTLGVERPEGVNSAHASSVYRATDKYNEFLRKYQGVDQAPRVIHTSYGYGVDYQVSTSTIRSLYQYLNDNKADYPTFRFTMHYPLNSHGI